MHSSEIRFAPPVAATNALVEAGAPSCGWDEFAGAAAPHVHFEGCGFFLLFVLLFKMIVFSNAGVALFDGSVAQLAPELGRIDAVFGSFSRPEKNNRDIVVVACAQFRVFVDIDFGEARAELFQQGSDLRFGFLAEVAAGARVDCHIARRGELQAAVFGARVSVRRFGGAQPSSLDQLGHDALHGREISQVCERSSARTRGIEGG
jgi:hypothetical protein